MKTMAVIGAAAGTSGLLQSCGSRTSSDNMEIRTLYFDNSELNWSVKDFYLVIGAKEFKLKDITPLQLEKAKTANSFLASIAEPKITHFLEGVALPADDVQLCYVKMMPKQVSPDTEWQTASMFLHVPKDAVERTITKSKNSGPSLKARYYGLTNKNSSIKGLLDENDLINPVDTATSIVFTFPEIMSFDPDSAAHVMQNIISKQPNTAVLAEVIRQQGNSWSNNVVLRDDNGKPMKDEDGKIIEIIQYSETTMQFAGTAINDSLNRVKQDPALYVNVSNVTDESQLKGKLCTFQDGRTYTEGTKKSTKSLKSDVRMTLTDVATGGGYKLEYNGGKRDAQNIISSFKTTNSYCRHLAMYVRYLDANNQPISKSLIGDSFFSKYSPSMFTLSGPNYNFDSVLRIIETNLVVLGVAVKDKEVNFDIPIPPIASKIQIIGNTLGHGDDHYKHIEIGSTLTAVFDLAIPALFIVAQAASSYKLFSQAKNSAMIIEAIRLFINLHAILVEALAYNNPSKLLSLAVEIGKTLLGAVGSKYLLPALLTAIGTSQISKVIPIIGAIISAVSSLTTAVQMTRTISQIFNSPWNYAKTLSLSHDVRIKIYHDPKNPEGFPSVATNYIVTATCQLLDSSGKVIDSATPIQVSERMSQTTRTDPIIVTIPDLPYGGSVSFAVGFYSDTRWLAGYATLDKQDNTRDYFEATITQNHVPLTSNTYYSHKEKTALDALGRHVWIPTTAPNPTPTGQCNQVQGQLCQIIDITDSNTFASVGYTWQAYGLSNQSCSGSTGQMYFFANMSTTQNPEDSYLLSCGQKSPLRTVYDLMGNELTQRNFYLDTDSGNIIRQIRLKLRGKPDFDGPNSNRAWGRLNFSSDSMLLHPNGKIVSINATLSKIEVLTLPQSPSSDKDAPLAAVYAGKGIREGLLDGPFCAALTPKGEILILETANNRIQAFDTGGNPMKIFRNRTSYFATLRYSAKDFQYLDMATEYTGYIYLLSYQHQGQAFNFFLDIYTPEGDFLTRTKDFSGMKIAVSYWRDVFTANMEALKMPNGTIPSVTEPSISRWIPSTP